MHNVHRISFKMERGTEQRAVQVQTRSEGDSLLENYHALLQTHTKLLDKRDVSRDSHDGHAPAMSQSSQMLHLLQLEVHVHKPLKD